MKSLQNIGKTAAASRGFQFLQRTAFGGVLLASLLASVDVYGQGQYYPVTNPGGPYGNTYTGITIHSNANLQALQNTLQTLIAQNQLPPGQPAGTPSLQVPLATGTRTPTQAEYVATVNAAVQSYLSTSNVFGPAVTLDSLANEAIDWRYATTPGDLTAVASGIAQTVIKYDVANSLNAVSDLGLITNTLAQMQPTLIASIMPSILYSAAGLGQTMSNNWGANPTTAMGVGTLVNQAIAVIPRDTASISTIVNSGLLALNSSVLPAYTITNTQHPNKADALIDPTMGLVPLTLESGAAKNNVPVIAKILSTVTNTYGLGLVPVNGSGTSSLDQVLTAAVTALSTPNPAFGNTTNLNNQTIGALAVGALATQSAFVTASTANRSHFEGVISTGTTGGYTNALVDGYYIVSTKKDLSGNALGTALAAYQYAVTQNPGKADAVASGGGSVGTLALTDVVHYALTLETSFPAGPGPGETHNADIVAAVIGYNQAITNNVVLAAVNGNTGWGSATLADIAWAVADAAPITSIGSSINTVVTKAALVANNAGSITTLQNIVNGAIQGATYGQNTGAFADIVYKSQTVARGIGGMSDPLIRQAIDSINTAGLSDSYSYVAVVAALAGDANLNRTAIQNAAYAPVTGEMIVKGLAAGDIVAAQDGAAVVTGIQTNIYNAFITTLNLIAAVQTHTNGQASTVADLYAAILANPNEADAGLALAIKQFTGGSAFYPTLEAEALNAMHVSTASKDTNLTMVYNVVTHIKNESMNGSVQDLFDYIGHQIVTSGLPTDVAIAATVVDPDNAHFVAHSVAFNSPSTVNVIVPYIFSYAQITNTTPYGIPTLASPTGAFAAGKTYPGVIRGKIVDQPAAAAAITAGLTTGLLEANLDAAAAANNLPVTPANYPNTTNALKLTVTAAVVASYSQNSVQLLGPTGPTVSNPSAVGPFFQTNAGGSVTPLSGKFQQVNTSGVGVDGQTVGAAGAISGYIAQVTTYQQTTISDITKAVLTAATGGSAARSYGLAIAQAAGQAFAWISGTNYSNTNPLTNYTAVSTAAVVAGQPAFDIATALAAANNNYTLAQYEAAVAFGISQANAGVIGAGALGLNATGLNSISPTPLVVKSTGNNHSDFYLHHSALGTPVTDIFNL